MAEVLITLGIIGVVAALTLPNLIADYKIKQVITSLKKVNSTLANVFYKMNYEHGGVPVNDWGLTKEEFIDELAGHLKTIKICSKNNLSECILGINYKSLSGHENPDDMNTSPSYDGGLILSDGTIILVSLYIRGGEFSQFFVDVNGKKLPNVLGRDMFSFVLGKEGNFVPRGSAENLNDGYCSINSSTTGHNGLGCTGWVVYNENMDYLKCNNPGHQGKPYCW